MRTILLVNFLLLSINVFSSDHITKRKGEEESNSSANKKVKISVVDAIKNGDLNALKESISSIDIDQLHSLPIIGKNENCSLTALSLAAYFRQAQIVEFLIQLGANPNIEGTVGFTALTGAASRGDVRSLELILARVGDINAKNSRGLTAAMVAAKGGNDGALKFLIEKGADFRIELPNGKTASFMATESGHVKSLELILGHLGDINAKNSKGVTAAIAASSLGRLDALKGLVKLGCDLSIRNAAGDTCLLLAAKNRKLDVIKYLLVEMDQDVDEAGSDGMTSLMIAAKNSDVDMFMILSNQGASMTEIDRNKKTVAFHAGKNKDFKEYISTAKKDASFGQKISDFRVYYENLSLAVNEELADLVLDYLSFASAGSLNARKAAKDAMGVERYKQGNAMLLEQISQLKNAQHGK